MIKKPKLDIAEIQIDLTKKYGLVLEGGGAKGAFQIGAFRALKEAGIKIKGVSGVSVGALNGALICMGDLEKAENIWENIDYTTVMSMEDDLVGTVKKAIQDGGIDISPFKKLLRESVDEKKIKESGCELFATTFSLTDRQLLTVDVRQMPEGEMADILLASSLLPVFKTEKLGGKLYTDGGAFNNVPLDVLVDRGYEDIIVIRIYGIGLDRERKVKIPDGTKIYHIAPTEDLGGILKFEKKRSRKNLMLGYLEAERLLYGLEGKRYYIYAPKGEAYYFNKMMSEIRFLRMYSEEGEAVDPDGVTGYRFYTEKLFPLLAKQFKLKDGWDYRDLYLRLLEDMALKLKIFRYRVYTVGELAGEIYKALIKVDFKLKMSEL